MSSEIARQATLGIPAVGERVATKTRRRRGRAGLGRQLLIQAILITISFIVLFPLLWVVSMSLDPRNISRPTELTLIPPGASLQAYLDVLSKPTSNPVTLPQLVFNSFLLAVF